MLSLLRFNMDFKSEIIAFLRVHPDDIKAAADLGAENVIIEHNVNPYFCKHVYGLGRVCHLAQRITGYKNQDTKPITGGFYFQLQAGW